MGGLELPIQGVSLPTSSLRSSLDTPREGIGCQLDTPGGVRGGRGCGWGSTLGLVRRGGCTHSKADLLSLSSSPW